MTEVDPHNESTYKECVIASDLRETEIPKQAILEEVKRHQFEDEFTFALKLALEEALTNAVKHGNCNDVNKKVTVRYAVTPELIAVIVRDEGCGFKPEAVPDCTSPERLPVPCGRGIMLLKAYMDKVEYRDNGREVFFLKYRGEAESS